MISLVFVVQNLVFAVAITIVFLAQRRSYRRTLQAVRQELLSQDTQVDLLQAQKALLTERLARVVRVTETWKTYALAYETLCECLYDIDEVGVVHVQAAIVAARDILRGLGEYDA